MKVTEMKSRSPGFVLLVVVFMSILEAKVLFSQPTTSTISPRAFGSRSWRENGLPPLSLPTTGNLLWDVRLASDGALYYWNGSMWVSIVAEGVAGPQGEQGAAGVDGVDGIDGSPGTDGQPRQLQDEGVDLTIRDKVNFIGTPITCVDNSGQSRTDCTISGGGSGDVVGPASSTTNAFSAFSNTTGKLLINTGVLYKSTSGGGIQVGGSSGPVMNTLGAGIFSFRQSDETSWSLLNAQGLRAIDSGGTIKAKIQADEISLAMGICIKVASGVVAGGGDTTLCRVSPGAWEIGVVRYTPLVSPPITCGSGGSEGYEYTDTSHAKCYCNGTSWVNLTPADGGSCS